MTGFTVDEEIVSYARHHAASGWLDLPQADALAVRETIVEHFQGKPTSTVSQLERRLFDKFAGLNLDWRLVAQTEAGECHLQGYIAAQKPGTRVRRMEAWQNSCDCCAKVQGLECEVVAPDASDKNWQTQVWVGKSRIHLSAVDRPDGNWPSAGLQHPGCRGLWVIARRPSLPHGVSKEFADWMENLLKSSRPPQNSE